MADTDAQGVIDEVEDKAEGITGNGAGDLGKRILIPAAAGLGTLAATYAVRKVPELLNDRVKPKLEEKGSEEVAKVGKKAAKKLQSDAGPMTKLAGKAMEKFSGGGGGSSGSGGKTRRLPIQRWTDIAAPRDTVYEKWTEFEEFPKFMHRVLSVQVDDEDENKVSWEEKIWFSKRQWEGEITDQKKNDRIAWKTVQGTQHTGVITFHKLDTNLTRVMVDMDFQPGGMIEKMASGMRFVKRAVQADLARFKAYVELGEAEGVEYTQDATTGGGDSEDSDDDKKSQSNGQGQSARSQKTSDDEDSQESSENGESERQERSQRRKQRRA